MYCITCFIFGYVVGSSVTSLFFYWKIQKGMKVLKDDLKDQIRKDLDEKYKDL